MRASLTIRVFVALSTIAWLTVFIDGVTDEGFLVTFLTDGLRSANPWSKVTDFLSLLALGMSLCIVISGWKHALSLLLAIYLVFALKLFRQFTDMDGYYSWIWLPRTLIPTVLFVLLAAVSIFFRYRSTSRQENNT